MKPRKTFLIALILILVIMSPSLARVLASPSLLQLKISTNYGDVSPANVGEYETGTNITVSAIPPPAYPGERYTWLGWIGTGTGSYSGMNNPTTITINGPITETASWKHEYKLTVFNAFDNTTTQVGEYWYADGTQVSLQSSAPSAPNDTRYVFGWWTGSGWPSYYTGDNATASVMMSNPVNETTYWYHQYQVVVGQSGVDPDRSDSVVTVNGYPYYNGHSFWCNIGDSLSFGFPSQLAAGPGKMYVWLSTSGLSTQQNGTIIVSGPGTITANFKTRYYLNVVSPHGTSGGTGWYDSNEITYATLSQSVVNPSPGIRYVFSGWSGDASGSNFAQSDPILMNTTRTVTAEFKTQYQVAVGQSGVGSDFSSTVVTVDGVNYENGASFWWDSSSVHIFAFPSQLEVSAGKMYVWSSTAGLSIQQTGYIITSASGTITANYKTRYYLDVVSPGGTSGGGAGWYDSGVTTQATLPQSIVNASVGVRYVFEGWSGDASGTALTSNPITLESSKLATALYKKQFLVVFNQTGLPNGFNINIMLNSTNQSLPYSKWFDEGTSVQFAYHDPLPNGFGQQYILTSTSITSPLNVVSPINVTAYYATEYTIELYASIIVPIILFLVIGIILLRRKKT